MSELLSKQYLNATDAPAPTGKGWVVTDKIFGYLDRIGELYNDIRYPQPGDADYVEAAAQLRVQQAGVMGLPKPWGALILVGIAGGVIWAVVTLAKKQQNNNNY